MQALISYAMHFLGKRGYTMLQTPFMMNKSLMAKVHRRPVQSPAPRGPRVPR